MALIILDTENADRDLTSLVTVLTDTPDASNARLCQAVVKLGDGAKDLDGTGGYFDMVVTVGGQTIQPSPAKVTLGTEPRSMLAGSAFVVPAGDEVIIRVLSPNAADTDVDVTAVLYSVEASSLAEINAEMLDVLTVDQLAELTETPGDTPTFAKAIMWAYMTARNKITTTAAEVAISNGAGTVISDAAISDDGSTCTRAEFSNP